MRVFLKVNIAYTKNKFLEAEAFHIHIDNDEIINLSITEGSVIDVEELAIIRSELKQLKKGRNFPLLVFAEIGSSATNEVNEIFAQEGKLTGKTTVAIVVKNLASRINAKHFKAISKHSKNIEVFTSESDAREWLLTHKE